MRRQAPLLILLAVLLGSTAMVGSFAYHAADGHLVYTLDDPYIHMAIARHFIRDGVWGISGEQFTSSSSSMLWTLLVAAGYGLLGISDWWPLALNVLSGAGLAVLAYHILLRSGLSPWSGALGAAIALLLGPVVPVMFTGLEHILHATVTLAAVFVACGLLDSSHLPAEQHRLMKSEHAASQTARRRMAAALVLLCMLAVMTRYEGLFLVFVLCVLFLLRRQVLFAMLLGACSFVPVLVQGLISLGHGWFFLPNSILMKGNHLSIDTLTEVTDMLGRYGLMEMARAPHMFVLLLLAVVASLWLWRRQGTIWRRGSLMLLVFLAVALLHLQFAAVGWFYRYELYLVVLGCVALFAAVGPEWPAIAGKLAGAGAAGAASRWLRGGLLAIGSAWVLFFPAQRAVLALYQTPKASRNIYQQQYQMGLFFRQFYTGQMIAVNDIGAVNYLADVKCLDLYGLANRQVLDLILRGHYTTRQIDLLAHEHHVRLIAVYSAWYEDYGGLPQDWIRVARLTIQNNVVCDFDSVNFYALDPAGAKAAQQNMLAFPFPDGVGVELVRQ